MDSKLVDMQDTTSLSGGEVFYVVQSGQDKQVSANVIYRSINNPVVTGIGAVSARQSLNAPGVINATQELTILSNGISNGVLSIANSTVNYVSKEVVMVATAGGKYTLTGSNISANVEFSKVGHSAKLRWIDSTWHVVSGTANVIIA